MKTDAGILVQGPHGKKKNTDKKEQEETKLKQIKLKCCLRTRGSSRARLPAGWIWGHQFPATLFQSQSE